MLSSQHSRAKIVDLLCIVEQLLNVNVSSPPVSATDQLFQSFRSGIEFSKKNSIAGSSLRRSSAFIFIHS